MRSCIGAIVAVPAIAGLLSAQSLPAAQRRDSAGVRIIEYPTIKGIPQAFRIGPALLADVGGLRDRPDEKLDSKAGYEVAVRLGNGDIAVAENNAVRVLDRTGKFVRLLGRKGGGPGEFNSEVSGICVLAGDTLLIRDESRRFVRFDSHGTAVATTTAEADAYGTCASDGSTLARVFTSGSNGARGRKGTPRDATIPQEVVIWRLDRLGKKLDSVGKFEFYSGFGVVPTSFSAGLLPNRVVVDAATTTEVKLYHLDGKLASVIRWRDPLVRVTPQLAEQLAGFRVPPSEPNRAASIARLLKQPYLPTLPPYSGFTIDRAGRIWVRDPFAMPPTPEWKMGWTIFNADGTLLGRYDVPSFPKSRSMVTDAGKDFVVVRVWSQDEGVRVFVQSISPAR